MPLFQLFNDHVVRLDVLYLVTCARMNLIKWVGLVRLGQSIAVGTSNNGFDRSKKSSLVTKARGKSLVHTSTIIDGMERLMIY